MGAEGGEVKEPIKFRMTSMPDGGTIKESDVVTFAPEIQEEIMRGINEPLAGFTEFRKEHGKELPT